MNSAEVLIKFKGDTSDIDKTTKNVTSSFGSLTKSITLGNLAAKAISKGFQTMSANMDAAIQRVDAMNNFPKVMKNLGISAEESDKAIKKISEKLQGLPTTLDSAALSVQRITSKNGDVQKSTDIFLAMNNAILAGGAPAMTQASAIEQLSQAYAKGKPDMMEWRSLMTAMPAQLKQVATAMGYVSADALGEALRNGNESMDEFMDTIVKLNTKGVAGFENFDTQARNATGGIQTSITNMKTAFARGVGDMISKVNEALKPYGGLNGVISSVGKTGEQAFKKIGDALKTVVPKLIDFGKWIAEHKELIEALAIPLLAIVTTFKTYNTIMKVATAVQAAYNAVMMANPIVLIIAAIVGAIVGLIAIFVLLWNKCEAFRNFFTGMWNGIVAIFNIVIDFVKNNWQALLLMLVNPFAGAFKLLYDNCEGFRNFINGFVEKIKSFFNNMKNGISNAISNVVSFIKSIPSKISSVPGKIIEFFKNLPSKMAKIGLDIVKGIGKGITNGVSWIKNTIKSFVGDVTSFIKKVFKIGSPSKLMENQIGQWIPKGIAVGIEANTDSVYKSMKDLTSGIGLNPQLTGSMQNSFSPNVNVYNNVNIEQDPLGQMVSNIKTFSGGAKNDYNYGSGI